MITIAVETFEKAAAEIQPLLEQHYEEITLDKHVVKLNVAWSKYEKLASAGMLEVLVARHNGAMIGYSVFIVQGHIHYDDLKVAANDVLFLQRQYRSGYSAGIKLIKESEKYLATIGVGKIIWHVKLDHDWSAILKRLGYKAEEVTLGKLLEV